MEYNFFFFWICIWSINKRANKKKSDFSDQRWNNSKWTYWWDIIASIDMGAYYLWISHLPKKLMHGTLLVVQSKAIIASSSLIFLTIYLYALNQMDKNNWWIWFWVDVQPTISFWDCQSPPTCHASAMDIFINSIHKNGRPVSWIL